MILRYPGEIEWDDLAVAATRAEHGFGNEHHDQPHFLYRAFDADGRLLYVGLTMYPWRRFTTHRRDSQWWGQADRVTWECVGNREQGKRAELTAIRAESPEFNKVGNGAKRATPCQTCTTDAVMAWHSPETCALINSAAELVA